MTITISPEGRGKNPRKAGALGRGLNMGISIFVTNQLFVTESARKGLFQEDIFYVAKLYKTYYHKFKYCDRQTFSYIRMIK